MFPTPILVSSHYQPNLLTRIMNHAAADVQVLGQKVSKDPIAYDKIVVGPSIDQEKIIKKAHPGTGKEFRTLIYVEQKGGVDSLSMFINSATAQEVHQWCEKRPTLASNKFCKCPSTAATIPPPADVDEDYASMV